MDYRKLHHDFAELLESAREAIFRHRLRRRAVRATLQALIAADIVLLGWFLLRCVGALVGGGAAFRGPIGMALALLAALVVFLVMVLPAILVRPSLAQTAQRLDLATNPHNQIATGLCLVRGQAQSPFARAAIRVGLGELREVSAHSPMMDQPRSPARPLVLLVLGALVLVGSCFLPLGSTSTGAGHEATEETVVARAQECPACPRKGRHETRRAQPPAKRAGAAESGTSHEQQVAVASRTEGTTSPAEAGGTPGNRSGAQTPSRSSQAAAMGQATSRSGKQGQRKPKTAAAASKPSRPPAATPKAKKPPFDAQQEASSISPGRSGRGGMPAVSNDWALRTQVTGDQDEDEESDEEVEDEAESSKQRGGIQPHLKDRNAAPSRELGVSADQGDPGTGRGGPTPPKKSRGAASLVLSIPVPDVVKGQLGPGANKVARDRSAPQATPGVVAEATAAGKRALPEAPQPRLSTPVGWDVLVSDYLIDLHAGSAAPSAETAVNRNP